MSHIKQLDHVGITVADLDSAAEFFVGLGLEEEGRTFLEGPLSTTSSASRTRGPRSWCCGRRWRDRVELARFVRPAHQPGSPNALANELGLRSICFQVEDLEGGSRGPGCEGVRTGRRDRPGTRTPG